MAFAPQQSIWVPYDPIYYTFPGYTPSSSRATQPQPQPQPTTLYEVLQRNTCPCPTCQRLRANGQPNVYQYIDEHGRPHNPPELSNPSPPIDDFYPPGHRSRPSREPSQVVRDLRRSHRIQRFAEILLEETRRDEREAIMRDRRRSPQRRVHPFASVLRSEAPTAAQVADYDADGNVGPDFGRYGGGSEEEHGKPCQSCASSSSSSGSGSSGDSYDVPPVDLWMEQGWGWGKGKEKEGQPPQEPEEELVMPTWLPDFGKEKKESVTSKGEPESPSSSGALSGSASREF